MNERRTVGGDQYEMIRIKRKIRFVRRYVECTEKIKCSTVCICGYLKCICVFLSIYSMFIYILCVYVHKLLMYNYVINVLLTNKTGFRIVGQFETVLSFSYVMKYYSLGSKLRYM